MRLVGVFVFLLMVSGYMAYAQLQIDTSKSIDFLVSEVLLGGHAQIENPKFYGSRKGLAYFDANEGFLISKGVLLSTGNVFEIRDTNISPNTSSKLFAPGSYDLYKITSADNFDATAIEFDFKPEFDSFYFNYVFASEEYDEFVGSKYNDVFGFFLRAHGSGESVNLAKVPGTNSVVSINQINSSRNKELYISNSKLREAAYKIEFDGFTRVLTASSRVEPGKWYHIKIVIADVNDQKYDSGVFLEAGSFNSISSSRKSEEKIKVGKFYQNIEFQTDSFAIPVSGTEFLDGIVEYLKKNPGFTIEISGHTDNTGGKAYNMELSRKRAAEVAKYLMFKGIEKSRISHEGYGSTIAIATNETAEGKAKNRRIEFKIIE